MSLQRLVIFSSVQNFDHELEYCKGLKHPKRLRSSKGILARARPRSRFRVSESSFLHIPALSLPLSDTIRNRVKDKEGSCGERSREAGLGITGPACISSETSSLKMAKRRNAGGVVKIFTRPKIIGARRGDECCPSTTSSWTVLEAVRTPLANRWIFSHTENKGHVFR